MHGTQPTTTRSPSPNLSYEPIDPHKKMEFIRTRFQSYNIADHYSYDELLFILDEHCGRDQCDRDVARELFDQCRKYKNEVTLDDFFYKYV